MHLWSYSRRKQSRQGSSERSCCCRNLLSLPKTWALRAASLSWPLPGSSRLLTYCSRQQSSCVFNHSFTYYTPSNVNVPVFFFFTERTSDHH